ncbi:MAG: transcriptional repressor [Acidobacteria bacterium]|nr:transcriptional repressor [Acidobacteriota bacterium]
MLSPAEFVERHRPSGGRRSGKRDVIVSVFLEQQGHLSAEQLADLVRARDPRISRATIYRTLQWMIDAGIARRVDFGGGNFRFEHAYRHPRHFHLICKQCRQSIEFLSSDIEALIEEVAVVRRFRPDESVIQIYGTCEHCAAGRPAEPPAVPLDAVFARDALRVAIATERSGLTFYARAARLARDSRGRDVFRRLADEEKEHLAKLEARYRELIAQDPRLESQPAFLFFKGASEGLFAAGAEELTRKGVTDREALLIGIRCERASHRFFQRYGERFEESEGKRVFLEFAAEEREHRDLLVREYRDLMARQRQRAPRGRRPADRARSGPRGKRPA